MRYRILSGMGALAVGLWVGEAGAATDPLAMAGKHNNNAPIEINSDNLEVMQEENKAVFTGHVVAIQAETRLKAEKMTVYYSKQETPAGAAKPKAATTPEQSSIKKIDVEGNVLLTTPEETASGANGIYDVENHKIFLNDHVVLTKAKNTLKGDHLVYDFATGKSVMTSGSGEPAAGGKKERVRALFIPENKEQKK